MHMLRRVLWNSQHLLSSKTMSPPVVRHSSWSQEVSPWMHMCPHATQIMDHQFTYIPSSIKMKKERCEKKKQVTCPVKNNKRLAVRMLWLSVCLFQVLWLRKAALVAKVTQLSSGNRRTGKQAVHISSPGASTTLSLENVFHSWALAPAQPWPHTTVQFLDHLSWARIHC